MSENSQNIVLLSENRYSKSANLILALLIGTIFIAGGLMNILKEGPVNFEKAFGVIQLIVGIIYPAILLISHSKTSRLSSKIAVRDQKFILKSSLLRPTREIDISTIRSIQFGPYQIRFQLETEDFVFKYKSHKEASKSAKRLITETADMAGIPVKAG